MHNTSFIDLKQKLHFFDFGSHEGIIIAIGNSYLQRSRRVSLQRLLASSSKSTNRTVSLLRLLNRFPSSPQTRPKPT